MVVIAGGAQIAAEEGIFLLVVAAEFGDTVLAHGGLDDVGGDFNTPGFEFMHSLRLLGNGGEGDAAGEKAKERERRNV